MYVPLSPCFEACCGLLAVGGHRPEVTPISGREAAVVSGSAAKGHANAVERAQTTTRGAALVGARRAAGTAVDCAHTHAEGRPHTLTLSLTSKAARRGASHAWPALSLVNVAQPQGRSCNSCSRRCRPREQLSQQQRPRQAAAAIGACMRMHASIVMCVDVKAGRGQRAAVWWVRVAT